MTVKLNKALEKQILDYFDYLHTHGEISMREIQTTQFIKKQLDEIGYRTRTFADCPGVIAEIGTGKPVVGLRADMDALWQEVDGQLQANHSCGHDAHMAMVLGTAILLKQMDNCPSGTIRLVFQPAEEIGRGAIELSKRGVLDDADYFYGVHLRPVQETADGRAKPAILHGACRSITGTIHGEDAHASRPHLGTNAIEVATSIVNAISHIHLNPMIPFSIKMTNLHAGSAANIIPGSATFVLDARAQTNEAMHELYQKTEQVIQSVAAAYGVSIELGGTPGSVAAISAPEAIEIMGEAIKEVIGSDHYDPAAASSGGDDFHQYAVRNSQIKSTMLGLGCGLEPGLHHPKMHFRHEAMFDGVRILTTAILKTLANHPSEKSS
ncbi:MAG: M20 peptidase aminoacylase family protein [Sporolactobacillus sp.]